MDATFDNSGKIAVDIREAYDRTRVNGPHDSICHAPSKHLYFGQAGKVYACCYSKKYPLGSYPENTISDILGGHAIARLRDQIAQDQLLPSCEICHDQLHSGNFTALQARPFDEIPGSSQGLPSAMTFELANTCNLECKMCSGEFSSMIRSKREQLPPVHSPYDEAFFEQLEEFIPHLYEAKFLGGEPFLIKDYFRIWNMLAEKSPGTRVFLQTNGTVWNSKVREILNRMDFHIGISIDSLKPDRFEEIRKNARFEEVMNNFRYFRDYSRSRNLFLGVSVCPQKQNWDEMAEFVHFCNDNDAKLYINTVLYPRSMSIRIMNSGDIQKIVDYYSREDFPDKTVLQQYNRNHFMDWLKQVRQWKEVRIIVEEKAHAQFGSTPEGALDFLKDALWHEIEKHSNFAQASDQSFRKALEKIDKCIAILGENDFLEAVMYAKFETVIPLILNSTAEELIEMTKRMQKA